MIAKRLPRPRYSVRWGGRSWSGVATSDVVEEAELIGQPAPLVLRRVLTSALSLAASIWSCWENVQVLAPWGKGEVDLL